MKFKLKIGEKDYEIEILENEQETIVKVDNKEFFFEKEAKLKFSASSFPKKTFLLRRFWRQFLAPLLKFSLKKEIL